MSANLVGAASIAATALRELLEYLIEREAADLLARRVWVPNPVLAPLSFFKCVRMSIRVKFHQRKKRLLGGFLPRLTRTAPGITPACGMTLVAAGSDTVRSAVDPDQKSVAVLVINEAEILDFAGSYEMFGAAGCDIWTVDATKEPVSTPKGADHRDLMVEGSTRLAIRDVASGIEQRLSKNKRTRLCSAGTGPEFWRSTT